MSGDETTDGGADVAGVSLVPRGRRSGCKFSEGILSSIIYLFRVRAAK